MLWNELVKVALLGTAQTRLSEHALQQLEELGVDTSEVAERVLMEGAALINPIHKAAAPLKAWSDPMPRSSSTDSLSPSGKAAAHLLAQIIDWENDKLLEELLNRLALSRQRLPPEFIPLLLNRALTSPNLQHLLEPVLGAKGEWLIRQHPEWNKLIEMPQPEKWSDGDKTQRTAILMAIRQRDPEEGIALLHSGWQEETPADKARFIKLLQAQLSASDEAFLEECRKDRRKEVRTEAARLLGYLPDSELVGRMKKRMDEILIIRGEKGAGIRFELALPEEASKDLIQDGINPKLSWPLGGTRAGRLRQMIAVIPPDYWLQKFDAIPAELLPALVENDYGQVILQGIIEASAKHPGQEWIQAIMHFWLLKHQELFWEPIDIRPLLDLLPSGLFHSLCSAALRMTSGALEDTEPASLLLQLEGRFWSDDTSRVVSKKLQEWISSEGYGFSLTPHYKNILHRAAYAINPQLFDSIRISWNQSSRYWPGWEKEVRIFLATLGFRKKMYRELPVANS